MAQSCAFKGNSDLYGLGIRLGVYLQWTSAIVAASLNMQRTIIGVWDSYVIFALAIMIALFVLSFTGQMRVVEVAIMLYLYFGGLMSMCYYMTMQSPLDRRTSRQLTMAIAWMVAGGYSAWFWLSGKSSDWFFDEDDGCQTYLFLFARIGGNHFNSVCNFFGAISIFYGFLFGISITPLPKALPKRTQEAYILKTKAAAIDDIRRLGLDLHLREKSIDQMTNTVEVEFARHISIIWNRVPTATAFQWLCHTGNTNSTNLTPYLSVSECYKVQNDENLKHQRWQDPVFNSYIVPLNVIVMIYSVVGIELMLHWNKITDIYTVRSVGQLIPFVIGLVGLVKVILDAWHDLKTQHQAELSIENTSQQHLPPPLLTPRYPFIAIAGSSASMQMPDGKWW